MTAHDEQCNLQAFVLVDLEQQTQGELKVVDLFKQFPPLPPLKTDLSEETSFNPHRITEHGCERIAMSLFLQLAQIVKKA
jgi:hypothetical protein